MKKAILVAMFGALTLSASAGDWSGKAPIADKEPVAKGVVGCPDTNGEISIGYMSDYFLHGYRINRDTVWFDAHYTFDAFVPLTIGVSHFNGINSFGGLFGGTINETDLYGRVGLPSILGFETSVGYTHRFMNASFPAFPNAGNIGGGSFGEVDLAMRRDIGFADLVLGSAYGINSSPLFGTGGGGWYHSAGIEKGFDITDSVGLVLSTGVGYHDGYFYNNSGWSNYYVRADLPISLGCNFTITPYIGYNGVQQWDQYAVQGDALAAGVSMSISF